MKFKFLLLLMMAVVLLSFNSKKEDPRKLIVKKWKMDVEWLKGVLKEEIEKEKKTNPEKEISEQEVQQNIDVAVMMFGSMTMDFKNDGSVDVSMMGQTQSQKWDMSKDGKVLTLLSADGATSQEIKIVELAAKKFIWETGDKGLSTLVFIPAQ